MAHQEDPPCLPAGFHHSFPVFQGIGNGFIHKDVLPVLSGRHGMLGMDRIRGRKEDSFYIVSLQDILKVLLLIASVLFAESLPFLRASGVAGHHF
jgi:hypothetical protein